MFIISITKDEKKQLIKIGYKVIESENLPVPSNIKIFSDTCMVVAPVEELGIHCLATDSTKCAHYSQNLSKIKTIVKSRQDLIRK